MKINLRLFIGFIVLIPFFGGAQVVPPLQDSLTKAAHADSLRKADSAQLVKKDTVVVTVPDKSNCYSEWVDAFRKRGSQTVPDGMQQVVIALKDSANCRCFMGQIEVIGGKMKPPLFIQKEDGTYQQVSVVGKKIDPAFTATMTNDELFAIKDGMSIVFRTTDQEYGRLFFYKYVNKAGHMNKVALSPSELIKD